MRCRGIRGATLVKENTRESVLEATRELLKKMIEANKLEVDEIACAFFTTTSDINAEFPALAARELGWTHVALLCGHEMEVPGSLQQVVRILILYNTDKGADEIAHVYINGAEALRVDLASSFDK